MVTEIIGKSETANQIRTFILKAAALDYPVLLCGETGVGKEIVAQNIHALSRRKNRPFVPVNCAGIPPYLAESELFGHRRGSFTDAKEEKVGLIEVAQGGTLLLDEIAESTLGLQAKLLRVIEHKEMRRVGDTQLRKVDVRFILATNRELDKEIKRGKFRRDFFFRVNVLKLEIPPLRERKEDIPLFVESFIEKIGRDLGKTKEVSSAAIEKLKEYSFPAIYGSSRTS